MLNAINDKIFYTVCFLLTFGCVSTRREFCVIAMTLYIVSCFFSRREHYLKELFKEDLFKNTCFLIGLFLGCYILSAMLSNSVSGLKTALRYAERVIPCIFFFILTYKKENVLEPVFWGLIVGMMYVESTVLLQWMDDDKVRLAGELGHPNKLGGWIVLILPLLSAFVFHYRESIWKLIIIFSIAVGGVMSLWFSGSRGAYIAFVCIVYLAILIFSNKKWKLRLSLFGMFSIGALFYAFYVLEFGIRRYDAERILLWKTGIKMFMDYPLLGVGHGNWQKVRLAEYGSVLIREPNLNSPHNIILEYLNKVGIVGAFGLFTMIGVQCSFLYRQVKCCKQNVFIVSMLLTTCGMLIHGMVDIIPANRFYMNLYGFLWALTCYSIMRNKCT